MPTASEQPGCMVLWLFFLSSLLFPLVSILLCGGTTGWIVSSRGGCLGLCTVCLYGTGAPLSSVTLGAVGGRLGLCCCCTDACSWPTLKGQDILWFRLAIYCWGCQHLRHSYPAEPSFALPPTSLHLSSAGAKGSCNSDCLEGRLLFFSVTPQKCFPAGCPKCSSSNSPLRLLDKYLIPSV